MKYQSQGFIIFFLMLIFAVINSPVLVDSKGGSGGWPSTTGNPSGGGRNNGPRGKINYL